MNVQYQVISSGMLPFTTGDAFTAFREAELIYCETHGLGGDTNPSWRLGNKHFRLYDDGQPTLVYIEEVRT